MQDEDELQKYAQAIGLSSSGLQNKMAQQSTDVPTAPPAQAPGAVQLPDTSNRPDVQLQAQTPAMGKAEGSRSITMGPPKGFGERMSEALAAQPSQQLPQATSTAEAGGQATGQIMSAILKRILGGRSGGDDE